MIPEDNKCFHNFQHETTALFQYIWKSLDEDDRAYFFNDYQSFCTFFENVGQKVLYESMPQYETLNQ